MNKGRRPLVRAWAALHDRPFFLGGSGKCAAKANWTQLFMNEFARARGVQSASLLDVKKCYENVRHADLLDQGRQQNYPLSLFTVRFSHGVFQLHISICNFLFAKSSYYV